MYGADRAPYRWRGDVRGWLRCPVWPAQRLRGRGGRQYGAWSSHLRFAGSQLDGTGRLVDPWHDREREHDYPGRDAYVLDEHLFFTGHDAGTAVAVSICETPCASQPQPPSGSALLTSARVLGWPRMLSAMVIKARSPPHGHRGFGGSSVYRWVAGTFPLTVSLAWTAAAPHRSSHCGLSGLPHVDRRPCRHLCRRLPDPRGWRSGTVRGHHEATDGGENPVRCPALLPDQAEPRRTSRNVGSRPGQECGPGGVARVHAPVRVARRGWCPAWGPRRTSGCPQSCERRTGPCDLVVVHSLRRPQGDLRLMCDKPLA